MASFVKKDIFDHLLRLNEVNIPDYLEKTIIDELKSFGLSANDIELGKSQLSDCYSALLNWTPATINYSDPKVYIGYLVDYLRKYFPRMWFIMNHLLRYTTYFETLKLLGNAPIKILDIGAGPGTMSLSLIEYLEYINQLGIFNFKYIIDVIEKEKNFLKFIENLEANIKIHNEDLFKRININKPLSPSMIDFEKLNETLNKNLNSETYDIIITSFVLNENTPNKEIMKEYFQILSSHLSENGIIVLLEAPSVHLFNYLEIDFIKEIGLIRSAPCLNANRVYDPNGLLNYPFFKPCGDLCTFQISPEERHRFCYLVLSKQDLTIDFYKTEIQKSIELYQRHKNLIKLTQTRRQAILNEQGRELVNMVGLFSDQSWNNYYFCNGGCKFQISNYRGTEFNKIKEGDIVLFKNIKFDGPFRKINTKVQPPVLKNNAELGFKYGENGPHEEQSEFEVIPYFFSD
ncbi:MAG: class I SAM-dependent methyltransferase [Candidatus Lokiarchaeia archaeon]